MSASQVKEQMQEFICYIVYELEEFDAALPDGLLDSEVWLLDEKRITVEMTYIIADWILSCL